MKKKFAWCGPAMDGTAAALIAGALALLVLYRFRGDAVLLSAAAAVLAAALAICVSGVFIRLAAERRRRAGAVNDILTGFAENFASERGRSKGRRGRLSDEELALEITKTQTKILSLQQQINPHFLYNTLETIRGQALDEHVDDIADMIEILARLFRYNISRQKEFATVREEIENIHDYMTIQNYRFCGKFRLREECGELDELFSDFFLPVLTLQPIVENAVHHGLEPKAGGGTITLRSFTTDDKLIIQVRDDGVGIDSGELERINARLNGRQPYSEAPSGSRHLGIALLNVHQRIRLFYGERYGLTVISTKGVGTTVEISLPKTPMKIPELGVLNDEA